MNGFLGKDGFAWFFGVVEDRKDPLRLGRVRVRVLGYHDEDKNIIPTKDLPWATPIQSVTSAGLGGLGATPVGLVEGSWVLGFFTDPGSYQIPMVLGSISGLNAKSLDILSLLGINLGITENFGTGFKDLRSFEERGNSPNNAFKKREYPNGKGKDGDQHGAQLETATDSSPYPRSNYGPDATPNPDGTPDTNILGINDKSRLDTTSVGVKTTTREDGGTKDMGVPVADIIFDKFETGIINESGVNKGTNKGLATGYNGVDSSSKPSTKQNYKQFKDGPTNANGTPVYSSGRGSIGLNQFFAAVSVSGNSGCYDTNMNNVSAGASAIKENIKTLTDKYVTPVNNTQLQEDINNQGDIGVYVVSSNGVPVSPNEIFVTTQPFNDINNRVEPGKYESYTQQMAKEIERANLAAQKAAELAAINNRENSILITVDENGNNILTDANGNIITNQNIIDENGNIISTDANGNIISNNNNISPPNTTGKTIENNDCGDCGCKDCK